MTAIRFAASLALAFAAVTSANAAEPVATTAPAATAAVVAAKTVDNNRYCLRDKITGSRLYRTACDSRQGWSKQGVDVDALRTPKR